MSNVRHVLHRQPAYCFVAVVRTDCQAGTWRHQHSGDGAAHSNGEEQLAQCCSIGMRITLFTGPVIDEEGGAMDQLKNHKSITAHSAAIGTSIGVSKVKASPIVIMMGPPY